MFYKILFVLVWIGVIDYLIYVPSYINKNNGVKYISDIEHHNSSIKDSNAITAHVLHNENRAIIKQERDKFWEHYNPWNESIQFMHNTFMNKPHDLSDSVKRDLSMAQSSYSGYSLYRNTYEKGLYYMYLQNVCYDFKSRTILYYYPPDNDSYRIPHFDNKFKLFRFTLHFEYKKTVFPEDLYYTIQDKGTWLLIKPFAKHVAHFFETISVPFNSVLEPNYFQGPVNRVLFANQYDEIPYNKLTLRHFENIYSYSNITIYDYDAIIQKLLPPGYSSIYVCFKTLGVMERNVRVALGGYFIDQIGADIYRSYIYKTYNYTYIRGNKDRYVFHLIDRFKRRSWSDVTSIAEMITKNFETLLDFKLLYFEQLSIPQQYQSMYEADITMLAHGAGEVNLIYMKPYSVVIEGNPHFFFEQFGSTIAGISRLHFIHLNNQNYNNPLFDVCNETFKISWINWCKKTVIYNNITIPLSYIHTAIQEAIHYLDGIDFDLYRPKQKSIL